MQVIVPKMIRRAKPADPVAAMPADAWHELREKLEMALEALGDLPGDFDRDYLANCVMHQREALKLSHRFFWGAEG